METVAQVLVNIPARSIHKEFSYLVPEHLPELDVGWRVLVPFGARMAEGFITAIRLEESPLDMAVEPAVMKPIIDAIDDHPWFDAHMFATAQWISSYYLTTLTDALRLFIPGKSGIHTRKKYQIATDAAPAAIQSQLANKPELYRKLWVFIQENTGVDDARLQKVFTADGQDWKKALAYLLRSKLISALDVAVKRGRPQYQTVISLAISEEEAQAILPTLTAKPAQQRFIEALLQKKSLTTTELTPLGLARDTANRLQKAGWVQTASVPVTRDSYPVALQDDRETKCLTADQQSIFDQILPPLAAGIHHSFLIHGITGSGKTQIYIEAVAAARRMDRQAIVLVPEIALTSQIIARFKNRFGDDVTVIHSRLSAGERYDAWRRLRNGQSGIVIGARSAIFAPVPNLGIVVVDEEHEYSYKQEESPRYHARDVAFARCRFAGAVTLLGSATPSLETYFQAEEGRHTLLRLEERINNEPLPPVTIVDMRAELKARRRGVLSQPLQQLLTESLDNKEQAIIMLNRRGYSTFVMCRECGQVINCPHCDISLVYHSSAKNLRCHYCLKQYPPPSTCPRCQSRYIKYFGTGTQKVEEELQRLFPQARIIRMDQDTTGGKLAHDQILTTFTRGDYDILLGTQMVAKGHDIENVTAVGIISADTALNLPDFRAAERTFALLTQVAGRAGRGGKAGRVVLQTYNPEHYAIRYGAAHNFTDFYREELDFRRQLNYPPFTSLIKIVVSAAAEDAAWKKAGQIAEQLNSSFRSGKSPLLTELIGPYPASVTRVNDIFRIHILLKTAEAATIREQLRAMELHCQPDVYVDIDPVNAT